MRLRENYKIYNASEYYFESVKHRIKYLNKDLESKESEKNCLKYNKKLIMTDRGNGKDFQMILLLMSSPFQVVVVENNEVRQNIKDIINLFFEIKYDELRDIMLRIFTAEEWINEGYKNKLPNGYVIHVEDVEKVLRIFMKTNRVDTMSTGHFAVDGYSHEYGEANFIYNYLK